MKRILILIHVLFCGYICPLLAEDTGAVRYQDSILKVADALPATLVRLTYLRDMAYKHQYAPYNMTFSTRLYEEARRQKNAFYENMGAYYLAACYDKKHDPDSLSYWVDVLKDFVSQVGTYDYYLEQKAAISRALASKRQIEKAVYVAKETLEESKLRHSNNGMIAAYNSLGCAYGVSSRPNEALDSFLEAYRNFSPQTKASLKVDILSRIAQVYGNGGKDSLKLPYLHEMDTTLQTVISKEPETRKNWSNFEIDCEVKYILHYMNQKNFTVAHEHIEKVKKAYPVYFGTYDRMGELTAWLNKIENLFCIGRNGQHRYNNMDHSMMTAFCAVDLLLAGSTDKEHIWSANTEKAYHEKNKLPENHNFQFGKTLPVSRIIFTDFFLFVIVKMERHLREECRCQRNIEMHKNQCRKAESCLNIKNGRFAAI
mgnify:CR=1 FL=1